MISDRHPDCPDYAIKFPQDEAIVVSGSAKLKSKMDEQM